MIQPGPRFKLGGSICMDCGAKVGPVPVDATDDDPMPCGHPWRRVAHELLPAEDYQPKLKPPS
jgi:hypothetical protein